MSTLENSRIPQPATTLGYAGALPFVVAVIIMWFDDSLRGTTLTFLIGFGAVILSFMGGVRWGSAMGLADGPSYRQLMVSIVPAAVAWFALFVPDLWTITGMGEGLVSYASVRLGILIIAFSLLLWSDILAAREGEVPDWYPGLRIQLTFVVVACLLGALVNVLFF